MAVNKSTSKTSVRDATTGVSANIEAKGTGENAMHVIASIDNLATSPIPTTPSQGSRAAFGLATVSSPTTLVEHPHSIGKGARYWDEETAGAGASTYEADRQAVVSSTTTANGDRVTRRTYRNIQYFKGKAQEFKATFNFDEAVAGVDRRIGLFTENNGVFLELSDTTLNFVIRSDTTGSVVNTKTAQSAWNVDKLDGTGSSGATVDLTKQQLIAIDYGHLGAGPVRLFFHISGVKILAHVCSNGNMTDRSWCKSGNLPVSTEIENTTAQAAGRGFYVSCMSVDSFGGDVSTGLVQTMSSGTSTITLNASTEVIIGSLRCHEDFRHLSIVPLTIDFLTNSGINEMYWRVIYRPTIVGGVWADLSPVSEELTSYTSFSGGFTIAEGHLDLSNAQARTINLSANISESDSYLGYEIDGTPEPLIVVGMTTGGAGSVYFSGSYRTFL